MEREPRSVVVLLLGLAGAFFLACAAVYNHAVVSALSSTVARALGRSSPPELSVAEIYAAQFTYLCFSVALLLLTVAAQRIERLSRLCRRALVQKLVLGGLALLVPLVTLEVAARPFVRRIGKQTSLFVRDDTLGWRMRPGAVDRWGGVTVRVNEDGLRGPRVAAEKPENTRRVLYLGDSVTFGYGVTRHEETFPFIADSLLSERAGGAVETINAGVGGYSPWQESLYLQHRGIGYAPDLVVVGFVLNDVTEKFGLERYGGGGMGFQLRESYYSLSDRIVSSSAFAQVVRRLAMEIKARRRLGNDLQLGAVQQQSLDVETLIRQPEQENVVVAWRITLQNLREIFDYCEEMRVPALLVVFPFALQLESPDALSSPQKMLAAFAAEHGIAMLDLLPPLHAYSVDTGATAESLFIDEDHLTVRGHRVVAAEIAARLQALLE